MIAGQHYKYLLRQMTEIRDGKRRNANPDMVKVIKPYTNDNWWPFRLPVQPGDAGQHVPPSPGEKK